MGKKEKIVYKKIEIEEKSQEPKIVDVPISKIESEFNKTPLQEDKSPVQKQSSGKQLVMNEVFGVNDSSSVSKKQALFKKISTFIFIAFVVVVLGITIYQDFSPNNEKLPSWETVGSILAKNWFYILFAFVSLFFCYFLKAFKLSFLCKYKTGKWHFKTCLSTATLGLYYNNITPLAVGGQPFEIYHLSKNGVHGGVAASLPIATFFMLQFGFVILAITSLIVYKTNLLQIPQEMLLDSVTASVLMGMAIAGIVCCFFIPFLVIIFCIMPRLGNKIVYFVIWLGSKVGLVRDRKTLNYKMTKNILQNSKSLKSFFTHPLIFTTALIVSLAENLALCSISYFTLRFFGYDLVGVNGFVEWMQVCVLAMILYSAISFIPTPGNSGAADLSFKLLFVNGLTLAPYSFGVVFPALLTWRFISFYMTLIIGFVYTKISKRLEKRKEHKL